MVLRAAGDVGCAHCKKLGADRACQVCTRLVCEKCAADWATCDEPSGRVVRLGASARVRDVDPLGRFALVSHWRRSPRLFDLRQLQWVPKFELSKLVYLASRAIQPRLTSNQMLVHVKLFYPEHQEVRADIRWQSFGDTPSNERRVTIPSHGTGMSATGDHFWFISETQNVVVQRLEGPRIIEHSYEPLPKKVVQAACLHVDDTQKLLASGSWSELALHRLVDDRAELVTKMKTGIDGDVVWVAIGGPWFAAAVRRSQGGVRVELHPLESDRATPTAITPTAPFRTAAISRDGRHLAIATDAGLYVHDLDARTVQTFTEHTDEINYVRFASDDHVLISADCDNRVILRPRTPDGYARPLIPIEVASP